MAKFNEVQKRKRAAKAERKRAIHGDPATGKLKHKTEKLSISGKRKQKLLRKWRREQKEMMEKGLVTMEDVEMASAEASDDVGTSEDAKKNPKKFSVKKSLKLRKLNRKGEALNFE
ncbi:PREDICTED: uncharacterized protein LOC104821194 isoform X2 [Tarenaya hassleriana]|uniref:uncharacterized protein LOC104821194 isoform X2 n=1 Tax=Tarenaya hassleriana TaxID=28532 RepID=UPI00053C0EBB|nr:PREDICTED: uncharacterized protein LOC104821194 isoform X2 [Tarenaya hassleriana]